MVSSDQSEERAPDGAPSRRELQSGTICAGVHFKLASLPSLQFDLLGQDLLFECLMLRTFARQVTARIAIRSDCQGALPDSLAALQILQQIQGPQAVNARPSSSAATNLEEW